MIRKWTWVTALAAAVALGAVWVQRPVDQPIATAPVTAPLVAEVPSRATMPLSALPPQGRDVMALIERGGPFRYEKDGTVFGNRERILPENRRGFYREYTVDTPGLSHRGARRIVCGGEQPRQPEACYYTEDHYNSFRRIAH